MSLYIATNSKIWQKLPWNCVENTYFIVKIHDMILKNVLADVFHKMSMLSQKVLKLTIKVVHMTCALYSKSTDVIWVTDPSFYWKSSQTFLTSSVMLTITRSTLSQFRPFFLTKSTDSLIKIWLNELGYLYTFVKTTLHPCCLALCLVGFESKNPSVNVSVIKKVK